MLPVRLVVVCLVRGATRMHAVDDQKGGPVQHPEVRALSAAVAEGQAPEGTDRDSINIPLYLT